MQIHILGSGNNPEIEIYDGAEKLVHTKIDSEVSAFRINCLNVKRVFSVHEEVIKKRTSTVLLNEYSQALGKIENDQLLHQTGIIEVEDMQMNYRIRGVEGETYIFFTEQSADTFNCFLSTEIFNSLNDTVVSIFLFSLCWYVYLSKKKQGVLSLALS